jgi:hypothetical protein
MSQVHVNHIRKAIEKLYSGKIDLSDCKGYSEDKIESTFLSRSLAAYALSNLAEIENAEAASSIVDGADDNGIDALYADKDNHTIYLVQSKWIYSGKGCPKKGDVHSFADGFEDLIYPRFDRFNAKIKKHKDEIVSILNESNVHIILILAYSGSNELSKYANRIFEDLVREHNEISDLLSIKILNLKELHKIFLGRTKGISLNLDIALKEWGHIEDPFDAYYGQIEAVDVANWYNQYGNSIFRPNLRSFMGSTEVNDSIRMTLSKEPEKFWYFNNGITLLCNKIEKKAIGGQDRRSGYFHCEGISVVNGAQTVGSIATVYKDHPELVNRARVSARFISLEKCPDDFAIDVTRATNTQNKIERRDFASLDPEQQRLQRELLLEGIEYTYKTGGQLVSQKGCDIEEATIALACAYLDIGLAVQAKREISKLWENIEKPPYKILFNSGLNGEDLWRKVEIKRIIDKELEALKRYYEQGREQLFIIHGNRFILHLIFKYIRENNLIENPDEIAETITQQCEQVLIKLVKSSNYLYPNSYPANIFKNRNKCIVLAKAIDEIAAA